MSGIQRRQTDFFQQSEPDGRSLRDWQPRQWPVAPDWQPLAERFLDSEPAQQLGQFIAARQADGAVVYPPQPFRALALTPLSSVRVVIVGQDPYHGPGQAEGLAFSVAPGNKVPPSLRNIFKELARDAGHTPDAKPWPLPSSGSLVSWARQGVLLLNTCLTVEEARPASHSGQGWEVLTGKIIDAVASKNDRVVFMLWGAHAQTLLPRLQAWGDVQGSIGQPGNHLVLTANHPSPLSARRPPQPFIGCGHFSTANEFLRQAGQQPVSW